MHSDIKYGPYLPIGKDGVKKQVYLVTFIDDATRFVLHSEFYPTLDQIIVEDCFRKAIHNTGCPKLYTSTTVASTAPNGCTAPAAN